MTGTTGGYIFIAFFYEVNDQAATERLTSPERSRDGGPLGAVVYCR
jgi:hypothetical protein